MNIEINAMRPAELSVQSDVSPAMGCIYNRHVRLRLATSEAPVPYAALEKRHRDGDISLYSARSSETCRGSIVQKQCTNQHIRICRVQRMAWPKLCAHCTARMYVHT